MALNRVLLVSYIFPPSGGVGVQRALSYARYLPDTGCEVFVVAARGGSCPVSDPALLRLVPPSVTVCRTFTPELSYAFRDRIWTRLNRLSKPVKGGNAGGGGNSLPQVAPVPNGDGSNSLPQVPPIPNGGGRNPLRQVAERLFSPDPQAVWTPFAIRAADRLIRRHDIGTVLVTAPPFSALHVGVELKRRFPHIRLISEFRDEWVGYYIVDLHTEISAYRRRLAEQRERETVQASDFVVAVTPAQTASIRSRYPREPESKFLSITNGYDPEVFRDFQSRPAKPDGVMTIAHLGTVYANRVGSPKAYLDAMGSLPEQVRSRIETVFIGRVALDAAPLLEQARCRVRTLGFLPQHEALRHLESVDYALLLCDSMSAHSGKTFDYLGTGKPVLALTPPESEAARILRQAGTGIILDSADPAAIRAGLLAAFERFCSGAPPVPDWEEIRAFERPRLVAQLVAATGIGPPQALAGLGVDRSCADEKPRSRFAEKSKEEASPRSR
jgi:hypothetical protein